MLSPRIVATLLVCFALLVSGCKATPPGRVDTYTATHAKKWFVPDAGKSNPLPSSAENLEAGRANYSIYCKDCHGLDGTGSGVPFSQHMSPPVPSLASVRVQAYADGQLMWIIDNGLWPSGMPGSRGILTDQQIWSIVLYLRNLTPAGVLAPAETQGGGASSSAKYVGSKACQSCHAEIYERWRKTPMANVVRDPREHPDAILPDLSKPDPLVKFTVADIALVYGSLWKQRYFTKIGTDYFPEGAQWDVTHRMWRPYFAAAGTDWWLPYYPADNMKRPTGPTCDGCHSVNYNVHDKTVTEWNVGCERCHGPGSDHVAHHSKTNIFNPGNADYVQGNDTCIVCHSQGRPLKNPIEGRYYDWAVGFEAGKNLREYWQLEDHALGETTFTHFSDGTGHKNRMQGNDFVQSVMYRRGVTCFSCHDAHGTGNYAELRKPANAICQDCHTPGGINGPRAATLEEHTHHKSSAGNDCVACHMPAIQTTIADVKVHAHTFNFIPPVMTDKYKIPNPCAMCHADKPAQWATAQMKNWKGQSPWRME